MNNMKNEKETTNQDLNQQKPLSFPYSEAMEMARSIFASRNLITKEQLMNTPQTKQDNTIEVTFLKRSKSQPQK